MASAIIGAGVSLIGANKASKASKQAAQTEADAADRASAVQKEMYDQTRADQMPFLNAGTAGANQLSYLLGINPTKQEKLDDNGEVIKDAQGNPTYIDPFADVNQGLGQFDSLSKSFGMDDYQQDPGYQFRLDEGNKALQRSQAARGGLLSGAAAKELDKYSQGLASQEYQSAYNRFNSDQTNLYNRIAGLSGTGQTAANTLGSIGQNTAANQGDLITGAGNAQAAGQIGSANAWNTGLSQIGKIAADYYAPDKK